MRLPALLLRRLLACFLLLVSWAFAHEPFEITTAGRVRTTGLEMVVTMTRATANAIALDTSDEPEGFDPARFPELQPRLIAAANRLYRLSTQGAGAELTPTRITVSLTEENDIEYNLTYPRPPVGTLELQFLPLAKLPEGFGNALNLTQDNPPTVLSFNLLTASEPSVAVTILPAPEAAPTAQATTPGATEAQTSATPPPAPVTSGSLFKKFFKLGIEHILKGYDHLLFLAGLLVVTRHARSMIAIITCFTLAHSITLALAALDVVVIPGSIVEPLIAASIVFVGVENLLSRGEPKNRWALTFAFGLIHGFGFASVLRDLGLSSEGNLIAVPLLAFNLGVEAGQLLIAALALPLLLKLHQRGKIGDHVARAASVVIILLGGWWLLERTLLS